MRRKEDIMRLRKEKNERRKAKQLLANKYRDQDKGKDKRENRKETEKGEKKRREESKNVKSSLLVSFYSLLAYLYLHFFFLCFRLF